MQHSLTQQLKKNDFSMTGEKKNIHQSANPLKNCAHVKKNVVNYSILKTELPK